MATQTIRVCTPLVAGPYTANVQEDGSNTNAFSALTLTVEANTSFWTFPVTAATAGLYAFQVLSGSTVVAYGWFFSDTDATVTIQDSSSREIDAIKNKTDQLTFTIANQVDSNALTGGGSGLDAAATRAALGLASANLDAQLADLPTVSEFNARSLAAADYFVVSDYTAPANSDIAAILVDTNELQTNQGNWTTATGFSTHSEADVVTAIGTGSTLTTLATQASVNIIDDFLDTEVAAIKAKTDQFVFTVAGQVDANALSGGGSGLDAAATRAALGMAAANLDSQLADLPTVSEFNARSLVAADYFVVTDYTAPDNTSITSILVDTNELQTNQGNWLTATGFSTHSAADAASAVWGAGTRTLTGFGTLVADVVSGVWAATTRTLSAFGFTPSLHADYDAAKTAATQTSVNDLPTNAELATALGTADDAVLAAIAALNNLSSAQVSSLLTTLKTDLSTDHGVGAWTTADVSALATSVAVAAVKADTLIAKNAAVPVLGTISNAGTATESYTYGGVTVTYAGLDEDGNRSGVTIT